MYLFLFWATSQYPHYKGHHLVHASLPHVRTRHTSVLVSLIFVFCDVFVFHYGPQTSHSILVKHYPSSNFFCVIRCFMNSLVNQFPLLPRLILHLFKVGYFSRFFSPSFLLCGNISYT